MEIVAGTTLSALKPQVWNPESEYYLPELNELPLEEPKDYGLPDYENHELNLPLILQDHTSYKLDTDIQQVFSIHLYQVPDSSRLYPHTQDDSRRAAGVS